MQPQPSLNYLHHSAIEDIIRIAKQDKADKEIRKFVKKYILRGETRCTLKEIHDVLVERGFDSSTMSHKPNDFRDILEIKGPNTLISLGIPLFPSKRCKSIDFSVNRTEIHEFLNLYSTPESLANFLMAVYDWLPKYDSIGERLMTEEKQRRYSVC